MREVWFESEGVQLFAVEDGGGQVIVMLHGGMANHLASLPLIAPLSLRYRVIAPDLRGSGKSWSGAKIVPRLGSIVPRLGSIVYRCIMVIDGAGAAAGG